MTVIAFDGKTIAADGLAVMGYRVTDDKRQKIIVRSGHIFAFAGDSGAFMPMVEWWLDGRSRDVFEKLPKTEAATLLVITPGGLAFTVGTKFWEPEPLAPGQAIGSGQEYAIAAMAAGLTAEDAVRLVVDRRLCIYCGGEVQVVNVAKSMARMADQVVSLEVAS
jgi:ATP-dependent protease HslVU (ClpYQ) peptidase subunit